LNAILYAYKFVIPCQINQNPEIIPG